MSWQVHPRVHRVQAEAREQRYQRGNIHAATHLYEQRCICSDRASLLQRPKLLLPPRFLKCLSFIGTMKEVQNKCFAICNKRKFLSLMAGGGTAERGVHLAVHLLHASVSCLGDGHYGSCCCLCVRSAGITEVLELTSWGCRQRMHKWDFVLKASEFCSLSSEEAGGRTVPFCRGTVWVVCHRNELITSDNLANDLHRGGEHIKLNELHRFTQFFRLVLSSRFLSYSLSLWLRFMQNRRCPPPRRICNIPCQS